MQASSILQRRPKSAHDPYSTPARRRRIIAEVAKVVLKGYYKTACRNVYRFRIETAAAIVIQCFVRRCLAYKLVQHLLYTKQTKATLLIQTIHRVHLAIKLKHRLFQERYHQRCLRLVTIVEHLWMIRNAKMYRTALFISRQLARARLEQRSATVIQCYYRSYQARRSYKWIKSHHNLLHNRRIACTILIQRIFRGYLARKQYNHLLLRIRQAGHTITTSFLNFHYKLNKQKRKSSAIIMQSKIRSFLARRRYVAWLEANKPLPMIIDSTDIKVELSSLAIKSLQGHSAMFFFHWCLEHGIVYYNREIGFHLGSVVRQVMTSVQRHLATSTAAVDSNKIVTIPAWDLSTKSDELPVEYQQQVTWSQSQSPPHDRHLKAEEGGDQLQFFNSEDELMVVFQSPPVIFEDVSSKRGVQRVKEVRVHLAAASSSSTTAVSTDKEGNILDEAMMHFENAVVYVPRSVPPQSIAVESVECPSTPPKNKVLVIDDSLSDSDIDINEPSEPAPITTIITVMLQAPEPPPQSESPPKPPPPIVNYDRFAKRIQRAASLRLQIKHAAAIIIQRVIRRQRIITRWHDTVYFAWEQAYEATIIMQCAVRQYIARKALKELKRVRDELYFPFGHDFYASDEVTNWAAFGMTLPPPPTAAAAEQTVRPRYAYLATNPSKDGSKYCNPPAAEVVSMLEVPEMPPGCLFPTASHHFAAAKNGNDSGGSTGSGLQSTLLMTSLMKTLMSSKSELYIDGELITIDLPPSLAFGEEDQEAINGSSHEFWSFVEASEGSDHNCQGEQQSRLNEELISPVYTKLAARGFTS